MKRWLTIFIVGSFCFKVYAVEQPPLFWPSAPAETRVIYVRSIYTPADVGIKPALLKKIGRFLFGGKEEAMIRPLAVAVDGQGKICVSDPGSPALHIFDQKSGKYRKITMAGRQPLVSPAGVALNKSGDIFLSDSYLNQVFCLDSEGRLESEVKPPQAFQRPTGLAYADGKLFVVDTLAHAIIVFDDSGRFIARFGQRGNVPGAFNYPTAVAVDKDGKIYVVDTLNFRVSVFDKEFRFLYNIGNVGDVPGSLARPKGVAIDSFGHIFLTDGLFDNVQIFSQCQESLLSWGESGHKNGEFWIVSGMAIDADNNIYIADSYNQRLEVFRYVGKD